MPDKINKDEGVIIMKNKIMQFFLFLALVVGAAGVSHAAAPSQLTIPFDFTVNGKLMKAGSYSISFGVSVSNPGSFMIRSADGKNAALVMNAITEQTAVETGDTSLIFTKNGDSYSLSKINSPRVSVELNKELGQYSAKVERVELKAAH